MTMERKITIIKAATYPLFFALCVLMFFPMLLPADAIFGVAQKEFDARTGYKLEASKVGTGLFGSIVMSDVSIYPDNGDPKPSKLKLDRVKIGVPFFKLLAGFKGAGFSLNGFDGSISGFAGFKGNVQDASVSIDDIDLAKVTFLDGLLGIKLAGVINGDINARLDTTDAKKDTGGVAFNITELGVVEGKYMGFELPKINFGQITLKINLKDGKAEIKEFKGKGKDVEVKGDGTANLSNRIGASSMSFKLKIKPTEDFIQKNSKLQPLLYAIQSSKDREGFYVFQIAGSFERPHFSLGR